MKLTKTQILNVFDVMISKTLYLGSSLSKRVQEAIHYDEDVLEILSSQIKEIPKIIEKHRFKFSVLVGYPLGIQTVESKVFEIDQCIKYPVDEIVIMPNLCWLKNGDFDKIRDELSYIRERFSITLKIVLNNIIISTEELERLSVITEDLGYILIHSYENLNYEKEKQKERYIKKTLFKNKKILIRLKEKNIDELDLENFENIFSGRYLNSNFLYTNNIFQYNAFDYLNKIIISPGSLASSSIEGAGNISIGFKSPLNEGIKSIEIEGDIGKYLSTIGIRSLILDEKASELSVISIGKDSVEIIPVPEYKGYGIFQTFETLKKDFGNDIAIIANGPGGENNYLSSTIVASDVNGYPNVLPSRGSGIGAVFGAKNIKAIIIKKENKGLTIDKDINSLSNKFEELMLENTIAGRTLPSLSTLGFLGVNNFLGTLPIDNFRKNIIESDELKKIIEYFSDNFDYGIKNGSIVRSFNKRKNGYRNIRYIDFAGLGLLNNILNPSDFESLYEWTIDMGFDPIELGGAIAVGKEAGLFDECIDIKDIIEKLREEDWKIKILFQGAAIAAKTLSVTRAAIINSEAMLPYDIRKMRLAGMGYSNSISCDESVNFAAAYYYSFKDIPDDISKLNSILKNLDYLGIILSSTGFSRYSVFSFLKNNKIFNILVEILNNIYGTKLLQGDFLKLSRTVMRNEARFNKASGIPDTFNVPVFFREEKNYSGNKY